MAARKQVRNALRTLGLLRAAREARLGLRALLALPANWPYLSSGAPDGLPIPPVRLVQAVSGEADIGWFLHGGKLGAESIREALARHGVDVRGLGAILDFGCGCGRVIRHWAHLAGEVHGSDYNPSLVSWSREHLPFGRFAVNGLVPPLSYADRSFDLVYALSVFTHLPEDLQVPWARELQRILRPDAFLLLSVHGRRYLHELDGESRARFEAGQLVVRRADSPGENVCGAYHPEAYLREVLAEGFEVLEIAPEGARGNPYQDLVLLRKTAS